MPGSQDTVSDSLQSNAQALTTLIKDFSEKYHLSFNEALEQLRHTRSRSNNPNLVPSAIFLEKKLGIMEAMVKYLREEYHLSFREISRILKRDNRVIWVMYHNAKEKFPFRLDLSHNSVLLPIAIFTEGFGPMEAIAQYLHDELRMTFKEIGVLLDRDNRTIWTCYNKAKKKRGKQSD